MHNTVQVAMHIESATAPKFAVANSRSKPASSGPRICTGRQTGARCREGSAATGGRAAGWKRQPHIGLQDAQRVSLVQLLLYIASTAPSATCSGHSGRLSHLLALAKLEPVSPILPAHCTRTLQLAWQTAPLRSRLRAKRPAPTERQAYQVYVVLVPAPPSTAGAAAAG